MLPSPSKARVVRLNAELFPMSETERRLLDRLGVRPVEVEAAEPEQDPAPRPRRPCGLRGLGQAARGRGRRPGGVRPHLPHRQRHRPHRRGPRHRARHRRLQRPRLQHRGDGRPRDGHDPLPRPPDPAHGPAHARRRLPPGPRRVPGPAPPVQSHPGPRRLGRLGDRRDPPRPALRPHRDRHPPRHGPALARGRGARRRNGRSRRAASALGLRLPPPAPDRADPGGSSTAGASSA